MEKNKQPDYDRARTSALEILKSFGYTKPPVDPVKIADTLGVRVYFAEFLKEYDKYSGFFDSEKEAIYVNKAEFLPRQNFTVAHELGHWKLHKEWIISSNEFLPRTAIMESNQFKKPNEQEADCFAANLLVPQFMLNEFQKIASIPELATLFGVSEPVINNRINFQYG